MKRIVSLAAGVAVGYVLGSRAGREKYEQIAAAARRYAGHSADSEPAAVMAPEASRRGGSPRAARERFTAADREELRVAAKERIEDLPGETALGNPDPAAGGHGDPKTYEGNEGG